ncbi:calcium-binding protein [Phenylobacterium sp.]|jgi:Ca2+-binding RTX toxin-like protein|uniref:calcium-binding protein n=1 Tax=Phenylobacterium sp. TaxID=1871053 RepID=UPI002E30D9B1|nr:calcium-binding protein [Phenylobacterium sp.]HEX2561239.1 calcium-binding protein [Phenylobacterium sp.]
MPAPTAYTFYGLVEDDYLEDGEQFIRIDPEAFGYTGGQTVSGHIALTGSAAASWQSALNSEGERIVHFADFTGVDFFFEQAATGNWTEADFSTALLLESRNDNRPLDQVRANLFHSDEPDGETLRLDQRLYGGARFTDDDDNEARVYGAWVPDGITPNLVYGTTAANTLNVHGGVSLVWGRGGNDIINVKSGSAFAWGMQGDDRLNGGFDVDFLYGGLGRDTVDGGMDDDWLFGEEHDDRLLGAAGDDWIDGGSGRDWVDGGMGRDNLRGGGGLDTVIGGAGDDILISGEGFTDETGALLRARSDGGLGDDHIIATSYATLTGGLGTDVFEVGSGLVDYGLFGVVITDFRPGTDKLIVYARENGQYATTEEILASARQVGRDVVFDLFPEVISDAPPLVLQNVRLSQLSAGDFLSGG